MIDTSRLQQSELWQVSKHLIGLNTVSALSNMNAATYLANYLEDAGFHVQLVSDIIQGIEKASVVAWAGPAVSDGLIISGHIDVVPFDGQPGWRTDPLVMQADDQHVYGRGVTDMKVFIAQVLVAAKQYVGSLKRPLVLILTCDEEVAGQGAERLTPLLPGIVKDVPLPRVALIGEPTSFALFPANKGYATFGVSVYGRGGHSSTLDQGLNAIDRMADVIRVIKQAGERLRDAVHPENQRLFPENPYTSFNNGLITGGLAPNMIAEFCQMTTSVRIAPGDCFSEIFTELQREVERFVSQAMQKVSPATGVRLSDPIFTPPLSSPLDDPFCLFLSRISGKRAERGAPFATDGGQFQTIGINSYIYGPGLLAEAHQPNESLPIDHFVQGLKKVEQIISGWCVEPS